MNFQEDDPVIARIREARHRISEACDHDPYKLVAHYMELQKQHKEKLLPLPESSQPDKGQNQEEELIEA